MLGISALMALMALLDACGGGSSNSSSMPMPPPPPPPPPSPPPPPPPGLDLAYLARLAVHERLR
jgi:hypothetical protein